MTILDNEHFKYLKRSYDEIGNKVWIESDFIQSNLNSSRKLFTDKSLALRKPTPKSFEVYALLSGLPFSKSFCDKLVKVQQDISEIIINRLHYWVKPQNFGVEHCVFKWPDEEWDKSREAVIKNELTTLDYPPFRLNIRGVQINPDGCVIAKGYDEKSTIFNIREHIKNHLLFIPEKQSGWSHVPLGRILEPIGSKEFRNLKYLVDKLSNDIIASEKISTVKFVHETRWYMEEKSILSIFHMD